MRAGDAPDRVADFFIRRIGAQIPQQLQRVGGGHPAVLGRVVPVGGKARSRRPRGSPCALLQPKKRTCSHGNSTKPGRTRLNIRRSGGDGHSRPELDMVRSDTFAEIH